MSISVVVPNYNGSSNIKNILSRLSVENFSHIYFIDDCSTDNSVEIASKFPKVTVIKGEENLGPAGNRNRILDKPLGDIVLFMDVDMEILSENIIERVEEVFKDSEVDLIGGSIYSTKNEPMWWNWGYEMSISNALKIERSTRQLLESWGNLEAISKLRDKYGNVNPNIEISFFSHIKRKVDWVSEACFAVRKDVFIEVEGFDGNMRYHADQDLCRRIRDRGYGVFYEPFIKVKHLEIDTFGSSRAKLEKENAIYYMRKHGIKI